MISTFNVNVFLVDVIVFIKLLTYHCNILIVQPNIKSGC